MNNVALLSEGGKVYAKKRRKNENKVAYVEFDSEKRKWVAPPSLSPVSMPKLSHHESTLLLFFLFS